MRDRPAVCWIYISVRLEDRNNFEKQCIGCVSFSLVAADLFNIVPNVEDTKLENCCRAFSIQWRGKFK